MVFGPVPTDEGFSVVVFVFVTMVLGSVPLVYGFVPLFLGSVPMVFVSVPTVYDSVPTEKVFGQGKKSSVGWVFFWVQVQMEVGGGFTRGSLGGRLLNATPLETVARKKKTSPQFPSVTGPLPHGEGPCAGGCRVHYISHCSPPTRSTDFRRSSDQSCVPTAPTS